MRRVSCLTAHASQEPLGTSKELAPRPLVSTLPCRRPRFDLLAHTLTLLHSDPRSSALLHRQTNFAERLSCFLLRSRHQPKVLHVQRSSCQDHARARSSTTYHQTGSQDIAPAVCWSLCDPIPSSLPIASRLLTVSSMRYCHSACFVSMQGESTSV
jgi:hypothetical protein